MKAFDKAKKEGISPTKAYMAQCAVDDFAVEMEDVERFVTFVYQAWIKDERDLSIDYLMNKASTLVKEKGISFLESIGPREFLDMCCY